MSTSDPLDALVTFGKYKDTGATWRQVAERDPNYALWLARYAKTIPEDVHEALSFQRDGLLERGGWGFGQGQGFDDFPYAYASLPPAEDLALWIERQGVCSERCLDEGECVCGLESLLARIHRETPVHL